MLSEKRDDRAGLQTSSQQLVQFFPVGPRQRELDAFAKNDAVFTVKPRLQFGDPVDVDDGGAMNSNEFSWIELRFERGNRVSQQI